MTRKLKGLGPALVAVLAAVALSASTAPAASFHSETAHTILSGNQSVGTAHHYTINAGTVQCPTGSLSGTTSSATTETFTVTPTLNSCTAFGFVNAPVDTNGCTYTFNAGNDDLIITCPAEKAIQVTAFNCHVDVGSQTVSSGISYSNNGGSGNARDVTVKAAISGLKYSQTSKSFPGCSNGTFANGSLQGDTTIVGATTTGTAVGFWRS